MEILIYTRAEKPERRGGYVSAEINNMTV